MIRSGPFTLFSFLVGVGGVQAHAPCSDSDPIAPCRDYCVREAWEMGRAGCEGSFACESMCRKLAAGGGDNGDDGGNLVLWNGLGSLEEFSESEVGPGASLYGSRGVSFVPGKYGNGFTSGHGKAGPDFGPWDKINPDYNLAGTVEFWWQPDRPYDDESSSPDEIFVSVQYEGFPIPFQAMYRWREHNSIGGFDFQVNDADTRKERYLYTGKVVPFQRGEWLHVAFVWDMSGIPGIGARYGVFVNNVYYPVADVINYGASLDFDMAKPVGAKFALGYYTADFNNQLNGVLDNVKVWDSAKTSFPSGGERNLVAGVVDTCAAYCDGTTWAPYLLNCLEHCDCLEEENTRWDCKRDCKKEQRAGLVACKKMCKKVGTNLKKQKNQKCEDG